MNSWSLGCLGWAGSKEKKWIWVFLGNFWGCFFQLFEGKKNWIFFENIVESVHIFLVILMILFTAEPLRFFIYISVCCWTFELSLLLNLWDYLLLLNLWILFTAEPLRLCPGLCICLLLNLWILFYCWTFEIICLLLNLCIFFTAEPLDFFLLLNIWDYALDNYLFDAEALRTFSSKQNHQKSGPLIKRHESEITDISIIPAKI